MSPIAAHGCKHAIRGQCFRHLLQREHGVLLHEGRHRLQKNLNGIKCFGSGPKTNFSSPVRSVMPLQSKG